MTLRTLLFVVVSLSFSSAAFASRIERVVSLAPNLTELMFAAGAGERLVGTVEYSDEPAAARRIPRVGDAFRVDVERILAMKPDVVLAWTSGTPQPTIERLRALRLNVREFSTQRIADVPRVVRELGTLMSTEQTATDAATRFERDMQALREHYAQRPSVTAFLQVNTRPLYTVSGGQLMSELVQLCGARNVFADLNQLAPQISIEAVIARDPQVIISTDDGNATALQDWERWSQLTAVRTRNLYTLPANDVTRATTRLTVGAAELCRVIDTARSRLEPRR